MSIFFKIVDGKLYVTTDGMIEAGFKANSLASNCSQGIKTLPFIKDPENLKRTLFDYEGLGKKYKAGILARWPKPYDEVIMQPIRAMIKQDLKAEEYYLAYRFENDPKKIIPIEHVKKYTRACEVLNMLVEMGANKKAIKELLKISVMEFWTKVSEMIEADRIYLPKTYRRLSEKVREYKATGYECLIDGKLGNSNGVKVKDEVSEAVLFEMIAHPNQYDDVLVVWRYNDWAKKNDRKEITSATVGNYRRRYYDLLIMQREGNEAYVNNYSKSIKGFRPTQPTFFIESDDNHTDYYFANWDDKTQHKYYYTFKAMFVTDGFNDLPLGYAIGKEITIDLVKEAYRNAMHYMKKLTGYWVLPHETKSDRWGLKALQPFYESMGHYAPSPKGSKKRGYIEQFFGSTHWERCIKIGANNYTGHNVTAKTKGVNREVLHANRENYPTVQEAPQYFADLVTRLRRMPPKEGALNKEEQWLKAWNEMPEDKKRIISEEQFLLKFGIIRDETNAITDRCIDITVNGIRYNYDIADEYYYAHKGRTLNTIIDPNDMSRILVTDFKNIRFIATAPILQSRAMADYKEGDRIRLNAQLDGKKAHVEKATAFMEKHKTNLGNINIDKLIGEPFLLKDERLAAIEDYEFGQLEASPDPSRGGENWERRQLINPLDKM